MAQTIRSTIQSSMEWDQQTFAAKERQLENADVDLYESDAKYTDDELRITKTITLTGAPQEKREKLRDYFHRTFSLYESLFDLLSDDDAFLQQPEKLRHPLIFYFGHTATFFINKLILAKLIHRRIDAKIESTCAVGVDEMSWDDLNAAHYEWPSVARLREYRDEVRRTVDAFITNMPLSTPITWRSCAWPIIMGIEHERIHLETSSVLFRQLSLRYLKPKSAMFALCNTARRNRSEVPSNSLVPIDGGHVSAARPRDSALYGWDNEYGHHDVDVASFKAAAFLVSNAEFYEFMLDGGYSQRDWWTDDGWKWRAYKDVTHPVFWMPVDRDAVTGEIVYAYRSLNRETAMPWDWPVDVNYMEAKAFCNWKAAKTGRNIRLPSEDEWRRLRDTHFPEKNGAGEVNDQPYWTRAPGNINLEHWSSACPVDTFNFGGVYDVIGNVWQHTETPISGYSGFEYHPLYDDFSVPTFDNRHNIIVGGSFFSTGNEATRHARYAFRRHFYQHAGFRYVESDAIIDASAVETPTETDSAIAKQIEAQFGQSVLQTPIFTSALTTFVLDFVRQMRARRSDTSTDGTDCDHLIHRIDCGTASALDVGCGPGRATLELANVFHRVVGVDNTTRMIRIATQILAKRNLTFVVKSDGELESFRRLHLSDESTADDANVRRLVESAQGRAEFYQSDCCNLDNKHSDFDLVLVGNVLEYLYAPSSFLSSIHSRIRVGGLLVIASTYNWNADLTSRKEWIGGFKDSTGESLTSLDGMERILRPHFRMVNAPTDLPIVNRINARNFEYQVAQTTIWQRIDSP